MAWHCRTCGTENPSNRRVCAECGHESRYLGIIGRNSATVACFVLFVPLCCLAYALLSLLRA